MGYATSFQKHVQSLYKTLREIFSIDFEEIGKLLHKFILMKGFFVHSQEVLKGRKFFLRPGEKIVHPLAGNLKMLTDFEKRQIFPFVHFVSPALPFRKQRSVKIVKPVQAHAFFKGVRFRHPFHLPKRKHYKRKGGSCQGKSLYGLAALLCHSLSWRLISIAILMRQKYGKTESDIKNPPISRASLIVPIKEISRKDKETSGEA